MFMVMGDSIHKKFTLASDEIKELPVFKLVEQTLKHVAKERAAHQLKKSMYVLAQYSHPLSSVGLLPPPPPPPSLQLWGKGKETI